MESPDDILFAKQLQDKINKLNPESSTIIWEGGKLSELISPINHETLSGKRSLIITQNNTLKEHLKDIINYGFDIVKIDNRNINSLLVLTKAAVFKKISDSNSEYPKKIDLEDGIIYYDFDNSISEFKGK